MKDKSRFPKSESYWVVNIEDYNEEDLPGVLLRYNERRALVRNSHTGPVYRTGFFEFSGEDPEVYYLTTNNEGRVNKERFHVNDLEGLMVKRIGEIKLED